MESLLSFGIVHHLGDFIGKFMPGATVILGWFVSMMAEFAFYIPQVRCMRVWHNFLCPTGKFGLIPMTFVADHHWNLVFRWIFFMTTCARDPGGLMFVC